MSQLDENPPPPKDLPAQKFIFKLFFGALACGAPTGRNPTELFWGPGRAPGGFYREKIHREWSRTKSKNTFHADPRKIEKVRSPTAQRRTQTDTEFLKIAGALAVGNKLLGATHAPSP